MTYSTTPELLKTVAAVATATGMVTTTPTSSQSAPLATFTGAANGMSAGKNAALAGALGIAAFLV